MGLAPAAAAEVIGRVAGSRDYDADELGAAAAASGNPVVPLAAWLTRDVAAQDEDAARWVHRGATSQDILDTAADARGRRGGLADPAPAGPLRLDPGAPGDRGTRQR